MFTVEAMLSARLNHPNIVQVFEFAEVEGERYLAMEYVHGINVGDLLKQLKQVPVPVGMVAHLVREISLALSYAHALADEDGRPLSLIHRDVSPSNIMIGYDGSVKLLDFGVAKALSGADEHTRTGALKGKVAYMSPEAVEGELDLDGRTDIFATGVVLYELLTGKRLFKGTDDLRTIALVRACKVEPPSKERADVPPELDRIVLKALARDREQRYQRAEELAADLNQIAHGLQWDVSRTSVFLKQNDIQPGSEPELRALPPGTPPPPLSDASPATMQVTVIERRGGRSSTSLPAIGRPRLRWALVGATGALAAAGILAVAMRLWAGAGAAAAPASTLSNVPTPSFESPRPAAPTEPAAAASSDPPAAPGASSSTETAGTGPEPTGQAAAVVPPTGPAAGPPVPPPVGESSARDVRDGSKRPVSTAALKAKRRRRAPRAAPAAPPKPQVDLKRGDVIRVF